MVVIAIGTPFGPKLVITRMSGVDLEKPFARPLGDGGLDRLDDIGQAGLRDGVLEPQSNSRLPVPPR